MKVNIHSHWCRIWESWSIIFLVNCNTLLSVEAVFIMAELLGRSQTSVSTFSMNSWILSTDLEMWDRTIFIFKLAGTGMPLSIRSKLVSIHKLSSTWIHAYSEHCTHYFWASQWPSLHAVPWEFWTDCWSGIHGREQSSSSMMAQTSWYQEVNINWKVIYRTKTYIWLSAFHSYLSTNERGLDFVDFTTSLLAT